MARENFNTALSHVLTHEGGWADHPRDPGGATMKGVTLATFRQYHPGASKDDLRAISSADLQRIYRDGYWNKIRGDQLPSGIDYCVFDFAVNSGPSRAARYLQRVLGVSQDGVVGPVTIAAAREADPVQVIEQLCNDRMSFLRGLSTFDTFGKGWTRRVDSVRTTAMRMVTASPTQPPKPSPRPEVPETGKPASGKRAAWLVALMGLIAAAIAFINSNGWI